MSSRIVKMSKVSLEKLQIELATAKSELQKSKTPDQQRLSCAAKIDRMVKAQEKGALQFRKACEVQEAAMRETERIRTKNDKLDVDIEAARLEQSRTPTGSGTGAPPQPARPTGSAQEVADNIDAFYHNMDQQIKQCTHPDMRAASAEAEQMLIQLGEVTQKLAIFQGKVQANNEQERLRLLQQQQPPIQQPEADAAPGTVAAPEAPAAPEEAAPTQPTSAEAMQAELEAAGAEEEAAVAVAETETLKLKAQQARAKQKTAASNPTELKRKSVAESTDAELRENFGGGKLQCTPGDADL